jgi:uncharacterized protein
MSVSSELNAHPRRLLQPAVDSGAADGQHIRVAVVGSGIAGLGAARALQQHGGFRVSLFEKEASFGGHAHTVEVELPDALGVLQRHGVDTGFLVYNERTYPRLIALLHELGVPTAASDMSFSVHVPGGFDGQSGALEWNGSTLDTVFAQRRNLASPRFLWMLKEILRFNHLATRLATSAQADEMAQPLGDFLDRNHFGADVRHAYLLPMIACIWSCPQDQMLQFPVATLIRFCHNHGLLQVENRPAWRTVAGGSARYVEAIVKELPDVRLQTAVEGVARSVRGVTLRTPAGNESFDAIVLACHAPQALRLLGAGATSSERATLGALRTQKNLAVLHSDTRVMPKAKKAWAAWNFERARPQQGLRAQTQPVCLHYWLNKLQPLPFAQDVFVSLNPLRPPEGARVLGEFEWEHPVFDLQAIQAQSELAQLQGQLRTWFCGAWCGYGFHEDGLRAGQQAAQGLIASLTAAQARELSASSESRAA